MTLDELESIFKFQVDSGSTLLYYTIVVGEAKQTYRHNGDTVAQLHKTLGSLTYIGIENNIPVFK